MKNYIIVLGNGMIMKIKDVNGYTVDFRENHTTYIALDRGEENAFINFGHIVYIGEEGSVDVIE